MKSEDSKTSYTTTNLEADRRLEEPATKEDGGRKLVEPVAVPSNTATDNSNTQIKPLRHGIDSLYLSYQGNLSHAVNQQLQTLKQYAQSDRIEEQALAKIKGLTQITSSNIY